MISFPAVACQCVAASKATIAGTALILIERDVFFRLVCLGVCLPEALLCRERQPLWHPGVCSLPCASP